MFDKCIKCNRMGESCVPNLWLLPFPDLIQWCIARQKYLGWTNQYWSEQSKKVPVGTINRIKAGDYADCKYSTIQYLALALIGGTTNEFACTEQVEKELRQLEQLEQITAKLAATEAENERLKAGFRDIDEQHRRDIRAVKEEYQKQIQEYHEQIAFLMDELKAWRSWHQKQE